MAKFWFMAMALVFGFSLASAPLFAQDEAPAEGEEAPVEGEEEAAEESVADTGDSDASTSVSLDKNLSWSSEDDAFALSMKTRVQFRMIYSDENGSGVENGNVDAKDFLAFRIRRAKTTFKGHIFEKKWKYNFTVDWRSGGAGLIDNATLTWAGDEMYNVTVGQEKLAFNSQEMQSSGNMMFADRSSMNEVFNQGYAKGITVTGQYADDSAVWVKYWVGLYNGVLAGSNGDFRNNDESGIGESFGSGGADADLMFNVRAETYPLGEFGRNGRDDRGADEKENPLFSVGLALNWFQSSMNNTDLRPGSSTGASGRNNGHVRMMAVAFDAHLRWFGINVDIEMIRRRAEFFNTGALNTTGSVGGGIVATDLVDTGINFEVGYMLTEDMQVGVRFSTVDGDEFRFGGSSGGSGGTPGTGYIHDSGEIGVVFNYFLHGDNLKATVDITYIDFQLNNNLGGPGAGPTGINISRANAGGDSEADHHSVWQLRVQLQWIF
ncbi:MAG: porin [Planctomycetota bacterium]|jgi:hypothetical protein